MQKECGICGKFFETENKNRKYCDDCSTHYSMRKREYEKGLRESIRNIPKEPEVYDYTCEMCGKNFKTIPKLLFYITEDENNKMTRHEFCSKKCKDKYKHIHATCDECGASLADKPYNVNAQKHFCDEKCKFEYEKKIAIQNGNLYTCLRCGKEFIRKDGVFCGKECYDAAIASGWRPKMKKPEHIIRTEVCPICKQKREVHYEKNKDTNITVRPCSKECMDRYITYKKKQDAIKKAEIKKKEMEKQEQNKPQEALCASCKTPYKQCERMQTNFRVLPKGAHYNENGILTICPKYKP